MEATAITQSLVLKRQKFNFAWENVRKGVSLTFSINKTFPRTRQNYWMQNKRKVHVYFIPMNVLNVGWNMYK